MSMPKGNKDRAAGNEPLVSVVSHNRPGSNILYENEFYSSIFIQNTFFLSCERVCSRARFEIKAKGISKWP